MNPSILNNLKRPIKHRSTSNISYDLLSFLLLVLLVSISFYPAIDNQFLHWDDQYYVTDNIYINQPTWEHLKVLLTKVISLNYHPLTMISLWLNGFFFGVESATPFIVTNIIIHALTSFVLYKVTESLFTGKYIIALTTAVLFAIHPMHVESVVWISERKDVLYAFFFFTSMWTWLQYIDNKKTSFYASALGLFIFSCLSKAMAVSLVPVLVLVDIYKGRHWWRPNILIEKLPFLVFALIVGLVAIDVQNGGDFNGLLSNTNIDIAVNTDGVTSLYDQVSNAGYGLFFYMKSFLIPTDISAFYPYSVVSAHPLSSLFFFFPFVLIGLWIVTYWLYKKVFFGLGFFLVTLVLVLQWIPIGSAIVADRYTYLAYIGLSIIAGDLIQYLFDNKSKFIVTGIVPCLIIPLMMATYTQSNVWQDHTTLFSQSVEKYPQDHKTRMLLATGLWTSGNHIEAIENIEYAINHLGLYTSDAFEKLANCYEEIGDKEKAIVFYNHSIELDPNNYVARYHRGISIMNIDPKKAIIDFTVAESSGFEYIQNNIYGPRGACHSIIGNYEQAIEDLTRAIVLGQDLKVNYRDRAITYEKMGLIEKAESDWDRLAYLN